jgi:indole-3-glycerol phosphate synthase
VSGFLDEMARSSRERVRQARGVCSEAALEREARARPAPPPLRLDRSGFDLIAEVKLRSPAAGTLGAPGEDLAGRVTAYAGAGAAAVSVLTEPSRFAGSLEHLGVAARALAPLGVPALRKDFLVDPYQLFEARAAGAGGVLLIVRMLSRSDLDALIDGARSLGLFVLLEAFDEQDLELLSALVAAHGAPTGRAATQHAATQHAATQHATGASRPPLLAGVNCRDLTTLEVRAGRLLELAPLLPAGVPRVAESGLSTADDARRIAAAGYELALVGSALMRGPDPRELAAALLAAGRAARQA